jgi:hypothetical protein
LHWLCTCIWDIIDGHVISVYYDRAHAKEYLLYTLKLVILLYIAASLWNILAGIRDGLVKALQPMIMVWEVLRWVVAAGW